MAMRRDDYRVEAGPAVGASTLKRELGLRAAQGVRPREEVVRMARDLSPQRRLGLVHSLVEGVVQALKRVSRSSPSASDMASCPLRSRGTLPPGTDRRDFYTRDRVFGSVPTAGGHGGPPNVVNGRTGSGECDPGLVEGSGCASPLSRSVLVIPAATATDTAQAPLPLEPWAATIRSTHPRSSVEARTDFSYRRQPWPSGMKQPRQRTGP